MSEPIDWGYIGLSLVVIVGLMLLTPFARMLASYTW